MSYKKGHYSISTVKKEKLSIIIHIIYSCIYFPVPHKRAGSFYTINSIGTQEEFSEIAHIPPTHFKLYGMGN